MAKQNRTTGNARESQKHGWIGRDGEPAALPFSEFLPPLLTNMVEHQFAYSRREEEELARWPIFESEGARPAILEEHARPREVTRPSLRLPRFTRLWGRFGQP